MYYMEWLQAMGSRRHKTGSWMDSVQRDVASKMAVREAKLKGKQLEVWQGRETDLKEVRAETLDDNNAIYCKTNTYLDACTYNDDKRGLLSVVMGALLYGLVPWWYWDTVEWYTIITTGKAPSGSSLSAEYILIVLIGIGILIPLTYVFFRYLLKFWRLEAFTMRRLVVRFNRETRKVYFLRPTFLGGVKAYNWEDIDAALPKDMPNHEGMGGMLMIGTRVADNQNPHSPFATDVAFVGNACRDYQHLLSFWEYIRRFMEDGADAVPAPKRLRSKWPNPLRSMLTVSRLSLPGGFDLGRMFLWLRVVLAPVFFIWGLGHYASLLLSYEPRFPKAIRVASHESEARSLLALLGYNLLPPLYTAAGLWLWFAWQHGLDWRLPWLWLAGR